MQEKSHILEGNRVFSHACFGRWTLSSHLMTMISFSAEPVFWPQAHTSRNTFPGFTLLGSIIDVGLCSELVTLLFIPQWVLVKYTRLRILSGSISTLFRNIPCHPMPLPARTSHLALIHVAHSLSCESKRKQTGIHCVSFSVRHKVGWLVYVIFSNSLSSARRWKSEHQGGNSGCPSAHS